MAAAVAWAAAMVSPAVAQTTLTQNSTVTQSSGNYVLWEAEHFNTVTGPDADTWRVAFDRPDTGAGASGGTILQSPRQNATGGESEDFVTYRINFNAPGAYTLYTVRFAGGDSLYAPPNFNATPYQTPDLGIGNRWNSIPGNDLDAATPVGAGPVQWAQLGRDGEAPAASYFASNAVGQYNVTQAQVDAGQPVEFRIEAREARAEFDRFLLHTTPGLDNATLNGLTVSPTAVGTPITAPTPVAAGQFIPGVGQGGAGFLSVREVQDAVLTFRDDQAGGQDFNRLAKATAVLKATDAQAATARQIDYQASSINIQDSDEAAKGNIGNDTGFRISTLPGAPARGSVEDIALVATGTVRIPSADTYTFAVNSDDGFRLTILDPATGQAIPFSNQINAEVAGGSLQVAGGRGAANSLGQVSLPAGDYPIQLVYFEGDGGAGVELLSASGARTEMSSDFNLVGGPAIPQQSSRRFTGTVPAAQDGSGGITVARFNTPAGANGPAKVNDVFSRLRALRAGTGTADAQGQYSVVNFNDLGGGGNPRLGGDIPAPVEPPGGDSTTGQDNYGLGAFGTLVIPADGTGRYTFDVHADDDSIFRILRPDGTPVPLVSTNRTAADTNGDGINDAHRFDGCCEDSFGRYDLTAPGNYTFEVAMQETGGGAHFQLFGAFGDYNEFNSLFQLVGQNIDAGTTLPARPAGLELVAPVPEPGALSLLGLGALAAVRRRRRR